MYGNDKIVFSYIRIMDNKFLKDAGYNPLEMDTDQLQIWRDSYEKSPINERILLETQEQTRLLSKINNNIRFFFWFTIASLIIYLLLVAELFN